jgi:hypothetical protein
MKKSIFAIIAFLGLGTVGALAQDTQTDAHTVTIVVPNVTLLDIEPAGSKDINMAFTTGATAEAGLGLTNPTANTALWLNYTSVVPTGVTRKIVVKYTTAGVAGVEVTVTPAAPVITAGGGTGGLSGAAVTLTAADQSIVTGIGSVFTGNGASSGVNISYGINAPAGTFGSLVAASTPVSVTYTLMDM